VIVLDASLVVELLTNGELAGSIMEHLALHDEWFIAPHLLDIEVMSACRRLAAGSRIEHHRVDQLLAELVALPVERYGHAPLIRRIWELRHNFTAYDAAYIALAEATGATLCTCDSKLSKGHKASVVVFASRE
jgi:predicted nucleic acid-binding protein